MGGISLNILPYNFEFFDINQLLFLSGHRCIKCITHWWTGRTCGDGQHLLPTWPSVEFTSSGTSGLYMGVTSTARQSTTWVWQDRHCSVYHGCGNFFFFFIKSSI